MPRLLKKRKRTISASLLRLFLYLIILAAIASGWWVWRGITNPFQRCNSITVCINGETRKILPGETVSLHPRDKVKVLSISTSVPFNFGVRLLSQGFDVNALRFDEMSVSELLPGEETFDHYRFDISIRQRNKNLGMIRWIVRPDPGDWLDKADRKINREQRLALLEKGIRLLPEYEPLRRRLIDEYKSLGMWKEAAKMLEQMEPDQGVLTELLDVYSEMSRTDGKEAVLEKLISMNADDLDSRIRLAELYEKKGERSAAIKEYEAVLERTDQEDRLPYHKLLGYMYSEQGSYGKAVSHYLKAAKLEQNDANIYYNLSFLYGKIGEKKKADFYLANAVTLNREDEEGRIALAQRLMEKGDNEDAKKYLSEVLEKDKNRIEALVLMARILEQEEKDEKLSEIYKRIIDQEPENETVLYNLGALEYGMGDLTESRDYFERYLKLQPGDRKVHEIVFELYKRLKMPSEAFKEAATLISMKSKDISPYQYAFDRLSGQGEFKGVISLMENNLDLFEDGGELREYMVVAYLKTGQEQKAAEQIQEILKKRPGDVNLWLNLARLKEKQGELKGALDAYKKVVTLSPGHEEAEEAYLKLRLEGVTGGK